MAYVDIGCRLALGVIFVLSVWSKLKGRNDFAAFVRETRRMGVPHRLSASAARTVVTGEVAIPVLLATPWRPIVLIGYLVAAGLLAAFTVGILLSLRRGDRTPCRCFGRSTVPLGARHVIRNAGLIALALLGTGSTWAATPIVDWGIAVVAALAGLVAGVLVTVADDLAAVLSPAAPRRHS